MQNEKNSNPNAGYNVGVFVKIIKRNKPGYQEVTSIADGIIINDFSTVNKPNIIKHKTKSLKIIDEEKPSHARCNASGPRHINSHEEYVM